MPATQVLFLIMDCAVALTLLALLVWCAVEAFLRHRHTMRKTTQVRNTRPARQTGGLLKRMPHPWFRV